MIEEYFEQTMLQTEYSTNDLLILYLYFLSLTVNSKRDEATLKKVCLNIVSQINYADVNYTHLLQRVLIGLVLYQLDIDYHEFNPEILSTLREIMIEIGDTSLKPTVDYLEAKYYLYGESDKEQALQYYKKAVNGADFFNDINFKNRVIEEINKDFS